MADLKEYFSIPNIMGYFRIILAFVYLGVYFHAVTTTDYLIAALIIGVSAFTDFLDGKIARRFHMITEWGKILDPIADKITQGILVLSFTFRYPLMRHVLIVFLVKEAYMGIMGAYMLKKGRRMDGAQHYGKVCTASLYLILFLLLLVPDIGFMKANVLMLLCIAVMLYSFICYLFFYARMWCEVHGKGATEKELPRLLQKRNWKRGRKGIMIAGVILAVLLYLVIGAVAGYSDHPTVSTAYAESLDTASFYSSRMGTERAAVISDNGEALDMRLRMIASAQETIELSTFDFRSDEAGKDMLAALLDAAGRGVHIRILVDGFSSTLQMEWNPYFYALSCLENVEIKEYNKVNPLTPWTSMGRMHDKYVIIDGETYLLGGRNTFGYFLGDYAGHKNYDWDVLVCQDAQISEKGSSLTQLQNYFEAIWGLKCNHLYHNETYLRNWASVVKATQELQDRFVTLQSERPELWESFDYSAYTVPTDRISLLSNPTNIGPKEPEVFYALVELMKQADEQVTIHTPYVICNDWMYDSLQGIVEQVPEVTLLTNSAANNGNYFGIADYQKNKDDLFATGIQILEYEGGVSYHGKCISIDDELSIIGSFNMDMRSTYLDTELMLVIDSEELAGLFQEEMEEYAEDCTIVTGLSTYEIPDGVVRQEMKPKKKVIVTFLRTFAGWARFLL